MTDKNNTITTFKIDNPHDSLFKGAFKVKEVAIDFLKGRLDPTLRNQLALHTLKLENSSFIDDKLKNTHSDVVFSVQNDPSTKDYIYFLIEHQTREDTHMMLRLLEYNTRLMRQHIDQGGKKLPCIINFVLYAGEKAYKGPKNLLQAFKDPQLYQSLLAKNIVIELNKETDEQILKDKKAALAQILLKHGTKRNNDKAFDKNIEVVKMIKESPYYHISFLYLISQGNYDKEKIQQQIKHLPTKQQKDVMNTLQKIQYEGMKLGEQRGIALGKQGIVRQMLNKNMDITLIQELTGLSAQSINTLRA